MRLSIRPFPVPIGPLAVAPDRVDVWVAPIPSVGGAEAAWEVLTPDERARADRYRHPKAREQFVAARNALRALLSRYLGVAPGAVRLAADADGKPHLADPPAGGPVHFNVSHTDGLAVLAVAAVPVGADVEVVRPIPAADALVERFFTPDELRQYRELPADLRAVGFLRGWTCKEAVLKGVGCGSRGLAGCGVDLDPRRPARVVALDGAAAGAGTEWALACWEPAPGYAAAVAVAGAGRLERSSH